MSNRCNFSLEEYCGRRRREKQVWAVGNLNFIKNKSVSWIAFLLMGPTKCTDLSQPHCVEFWLECMISHGEERDQFLSQTIKISFCSLSPMNEEFPITIWILFKKYQFSFQYCTNNRIIYDLVSFFSFQSKNSIDTWWLDRQEYSQHILHFVEVHWSLNVEIHKVAVLLLQLDIASQKNEFCEIE